MAVSEPSELGGVESPLTVYTSTGIDLDVPVSVRPSNYGVNQLTISYPSSNVFWSKIRVQRKFGEYPLDPFDGDNIYAADNTSDLSIRVTDVDWRGGIKSLSEGYPFNGGAVSTTATAWTDITPIATTSSGTEARFDVYRYANNANLTPLKIASQSSAFNNASQSFIRRLTVSVTGTAANTLTCSTTGIAIGDSVSATTGTNITDGAYVTVVGAGNVTLSSPGGVNSVTGAVTSAFFTKRGKDYAIGDTIYLPGANIGGSAYSASTMVPRTESTVLGKTGYIQIFDNGVVASTSNTVSAGTRQGETAYYRVFIFVTYDGSLINTSTVNESYWLASSATSCRFVKNYGSTDLMMKLLPGVYTKDATGNENADLKSFLSLLAFQYDTYRTLVDGVYDYSDIKNIDENLLKQALLQFNLNYANIGRIRNAKQVLSRAVKYSDERGSYQGIKNFIKMYAGYCMSASQGVNLLPSYEHASAEDSAQVFTPVPYYSGYRSINVPGSPTYLSTPLISAFSSDVSQTPFAKPENFTKTQYIFGSYGTTGTTSVKSKHGSLRVTAPSTGATSAIRLTLGPVQSVVVPAYSRTSTVFSTNAAPTTVAITKIYSWVDDPTQLIVRTGSDLPPAMIGSKVVIASTGISSFNGTGTVEDIGFSHYNTASVESEVYYLRVSGINTAGVVNTATTGTIKTDHYNYAAGNIVADTGHYWKKGSSYIMAAPVPKPGSYVIGDPAVIAPGTIVSSVNQYGLVKLSQPLLSDLKVALATTPSLPTFNPNTIYFTTAGTDKASMASLMPKVDPGSTYTFSYYAASATVAGIGSRFWGEIRFWDASGNPLGVEDISNPGGTIGNNSTANSIGDWNRITVVATAPATACYAECIVGVLNTAGEVSWLDGFQLEKASTPTAFQETRNIQLNIIADRVNELVGASCESITPWTSVIGGASLPSLVATNTALIGSNVIQAQIPTTASGFTYYSKPATVIKASSRLNSSGGATHTITTDTLHNVIKGQQVELRLPGTVTTATVTKITNDRVYECTTTNVATLNINRLAKDTSLPSRTLAAFSYSINPVNVPATSQVHIVYSDNNTTTRTSGSAVITHPDKDYSFSAFVRRAAAAGSTRIGAIPVIGGNGIGIGGDNYTYAVPGNPANFINFSSGNKIAKIQFDKNTRTLTVHTVAEHFISTGDSVDILGLTTNEAGTTLPFNSSGLSVNYTVSSTTPTSISMVASGSANPIISYYNVDIPLSNVVADPGATAFVPVVVKSIGVESGSGSFGWTQVAASARNLGSGCRPGIAFFALQTGGTGLNVQIDKALFEAGDAILPYFDGSTDGVNSVPSTTTTAVTQSSLWEGTANLSRSHYYYDYGNAKTKLPTLLSNEIYFGNGVNSFADYYANWRAVYVQSTLTSSTPVYTSSFAPYTASTSISTVLTATTAAPVKTFGSIGSDAYYRINDYNDNAREITRIKAYSTTVGFRDGTSDTRVLIQYALTSPQSRRANFKSGEFVFIDGVRNGNAGDGLPNSVSATYPTEIRVADTTKATFSINTGAPVGTLIPGVHGAITAASKLGSVVTFTSNGHGLGNNDYVYISNVTGTGTTYNVPENAPLQVTYVNLNQFSIDYGTAPGTYTSGGRWWTNTPEPTGQTWQVTRAEQTLISSEWPFMYDIKYATSITGTGGLDRYYYNYFSVPDAIADFQVPPK